MRNLKLAVLAILCAVVVTSCGTTKKTLRRQAKCEKWGVCQTTKDCTVVIEKMRIDTVVTDNSEMWVDFLFECDSTGAVYVRAIDSLATENVNLKTKLKDNRLVIYAQSPSDQIPCPPAMSRIEYRDKVVRSVTNKLTGWQTFLHWSGLAMWACFVLFLAFMILKSYIYNKAD